MVYRQTARWFPHVLGAATGTRRQRAGTHARGTGPTSVGNALDAGSTVGRSQELWGDDGGNGEYSGEADDGGGDGDGGDWDQADDDLKSTTTGYV